MAYRTILVHIANPARATALMAAGLEIARAHDAHLIGLYVFPAHRITPPLPLPFGADIAAKIRKTIADDVAAARKAFDDACQGQQLVTEWRSITTERRDACEVVLEHARAADLVIASQADPSWDLSPMMEFPDRLAIESGRPVLVIPAGGHFGRMPRSIVVAWNNRREAARALADALPLLARAESVAVVTVEEADGAREGKLPDTEIGAALGRHGVKAEIATIPRGNTAVGEAIRTFATVNGADLLVMGAYGQSRFREFAFGGATRHMLRDMSMPVLFSH